MRDLFTDALQCVWEFGNSYGAITPRLHDALKSVGTMEVLDLCSGGGGPWRRLALDLERDFLLLVHVKLSDRHPNLDAFEQARLRSNRKIGSMDQSVDALHVPEDLTGFRTMFSSFHHFGPEDGLRILRDAMEHDRGIGIFEVPGRDLKTMLMVCITPLLVLWLTPRIQPFRWSRLFWTYLVPVIPFAIWFDGVMSCFRAYSPEELEEMVAELKEFAEREHYLWQVGQERKGLLSVTYVIGCPSKIACPDWKISESNGGLLTQEQHV